MYHVGAREYDPRTGRWLQRDPIDTASGDPNLYRYCGNDPLNHYDPDGTQEHCSVTCKRGRDEIVRMALEEARAAGQSIRSTSWWNFGREFFQHHIFPQALRKIFRRVGIDVDDCIIVVADWFHSWIHSGGGKGGWWNKEWNDFIDRAEKYFNQKGETLVGKKGYKPLSDCSKDLFRKEAYNWARKMLEAVGITDFDWSECLKYNSKEAKKVIDSLRRIGQ